MLEKAQINYFEGNYQASFEACLQGLEELDDNNNPALEDLRVALVDLAALSALKLEIPEAVEFCARSFESHKDSAFYALNLAKALVVAKKYEESIVLLEGLVKDETTLHLECLKLLLEVYRIQNLRENAEEIFELLLQETPRDWEMWLEYGDMYLENTPQKALEIYSTCSKFVKEYLQELLNRTPFVEVPYHFEHGSLDARMPLNAKMIENPEIISLREFLHTKLEVNMADAVLNLFEKPLEEAHWALEMLMQLQEYNANNANFWIVFARALEYTGNYKQAEQAYNRIFEIPNAPEHIVSVGRFWLAYLLMRQERFHESLVLYEYRLHFACAETFSLEHYNLASTAFSQDRDVFRGKEICVYCEQGFGDTLMFARLLEGICAIASKVYFIPQSALYPLFAENPLKEKCFENLEVLAGIPQRFDFALPLTSLLYFLSLDTLEKILALKSPLNIRRKRKVKNKVKRVGFFWHTNFAVKEVNTRNFSLEFFLSFLLELDNVKLVSLQVGDFDLPECVENAGRNFRDWQDTYLAMQHLDCVVGIDSSPAHLSLNMGIPTLVILQPRFDWRFGLYEAPSAKFYQQNSHVFVANPNDLSVKEDIKNQLKQLLKSSKV